MRRTLVPYRDSIKGVSQRTTSSRQAQRTSVVVAKTIGNFYRTGFIVIYDLRVSIVHNERLCGYVLRSWPGTKKLEAGSRRIFNPARGDNLSTLFIGRNGGRPPLTRSGTNRNSPSIRQGTPEAGDHRRACQKNDVLRTPIHQGLSWQTLSESCGFRRWTSSISQLYCRIS